MNDNKKAMRKLRLQVQMSVDGCIAGPNNEMDWLVWDDDYLKYLNDITESVDTIIMGRKMVKGFIPYWREVANKPDDPMYEIAKKMIETPKIVFTKSLNKSEWPNTEIATGDLKDEITKLKNLDGRDIIVYGGISFDSSLIKEKLIDEFYLFINPIILGSGKTIFKDFKEIQKLTLIESKVFDCGLVLLHYAVKKN
ncbi:dihydrofolate reductase family protein [Candidatus Nitrosocosmicus arcticus]|uniref:Bifunctional deaminase-reductase domain protein n=1 Tax=Candidatus Nitrosocosmicus arcticus TaxID=2035267 RepID=A0A557SZ25_9ARCH|nr:dihydrofolate reductase family protein [Candidatus Nitrosocosmicus arcticus]TVP41848.1 Bifunctional deaminase-reductase domain protein [Candidatus Nitrosocosmicus arcticus]